MKVLEPCVRATPGEVWAATAPKSRVAAPAVVGLAERVTVVPETLSTVVLAASTPVLPTATETGMPG